jgi:hypothetical protein
MRFAKNFSTGAGTVLVLGLLLWLAGCGRFRPHPKADYVYVMVRQTFLRDRVAAVSNRVAPVVNGQRLEVVERGRRFLKVKTEKNEVGWIEERSVIDDPTYQKFLDLNKLHQKDPVVATAVLRDDLYMHLTAGRDTERFFLLPENAKLQLLVRASVPKPQSVLGTLPKPVARPAPGKGKAAKDAKPVAAAKPGVAVDAAPVDEKAAEAPPVPLEDWWLVRDAQGNVGWLLSRRLDVDVPDAIAGYSEGQKLVGAYVLATVVDDEAASPDHRVPEYVAVLNAYKDGLPYDFDQVRVFTWNTKKHRYETAYRQRSLEGYLPVEVGTQTFDKQGPVPTFSFKVATGEDVALDPATGVAKQAQTETLTFRMDGVMVKRVVPASLTPQKPATSVKAADKRARHAKNRRAY